MAVNAGGAGVMSGLFEQMLDQHIMQTKIMLA